MKNNFKKTQGIILLLEVIIAACAGLLVFSALLSAVDWSELKPQINSFIQGFQHRPSCLNGVCVTTYENGKISGVTCKCG